MAQTIGTVLIDVKSDTSQLIAGMNKAEKAVDSAVKNIKNTIGGLAAAYMSLSTIQTFAGSIKSSIDAADKLGKVAETLSITAEAYSKLQHAADMAGVSNEQLEAAMAAMVRRTTNFVRDGSGAAAQAFSELGISAQFAKEHFTDTNTTFEIIADRLSKLPDHYRKTAIAQDIFSKSAADIIRVTNLGADGLKAMGDEAMRLGIVIHDDFAQKSAHLNDQIETLEKQFQGISNAIAEKFIPNMIGAARAMEEFLGIKREYSKIEIIDAIRQINQDLDELRSKAQSQPLLAQTFYAQMSTLSTELSRLTLNLKEIEKAEHHIKSPADILASIEHNTKLANTNAEIERMLDLMIAQAQNAAKLAELEEQQRKEIEDISKKALQQSENAFMDYYESLGYYEEAWAIKSSQIWQEYTPLLGEEKAKKYLDILKKEYFEKLEKQAQLSYKALDTTWDNITSSMGKSLENNLFNVFKSGFKDVRSLAKNLGNDLISTITQPLYRSLSSSFAGAILPSYGIAQVASSYGLSLVNGQYTGMVNGTHVIADASGHIIQGANALGGISNLASDLSMVGGLTTTYNAFSKSNSILLNGFNGVANLLGNYGFSSIGGMLSNFGTGFAHPLSFAAQSPLAGLYGSGIAAEIPLATYAGGMLSSGLIGYGMGSLGDALFGAKTQAGTLGAVGAAIGSIIPGVGTIVGGLVGSFLGGLFGSTKQTDSGINFGSLTGNGQGFGDIQSYIDYKKKSWFSSSSWTDYTDLTSTQRKQIEAVFDTYDYLLTQLGDSDKIFLEAGKYSAETFQDALAKNFITAFTDIDQSTNSTIYDMWVEYADSVNKTVLEALSESINTYISEKRTFSVWALGDSLDALSLKAQYAQEDFDNLANMMGVTGVTIENYLQKYDEAVKNSFDETTITNWKNLGDALMSATDAAKLYADAIFAQQETQYNTTLNYFSQIATLKASLLDLEYQKALMTQGFSEDNLNALKEQSNAVQKMMTLAQAMRDRLLTSDTIVAAYQSALMEAKADFSIGNYDATSIERFNTLASSYADSLKNTSLSEEDYKFGVLKIASEIESITGGGLATLDTLQDEITRVERGLASLDISLDTQISILQSQRDTIVTQSQLQIQALQNLLGGNSPLVLAMNVALNALAKGSTSITLPTYQDATSGTAASVYDIYSKYNLNQYQTDTSGYEYWINQVNSGVLSASQLDTAIANAAIQTFVNSGASYADIYAKAQDSNISSVQLAQATGWSQSDINAWVKENNLTPFADGGIVTQPTRALIGEAGYPEAVIPLKNGAGLKVDMGEGFAKLENRLSRQEEIQKQQSRSLAKIARILEMADNQGSLKVSA